MSFRFVACDDRMTHLVAQQMHGGAGAPAADVPRAPVESPADARGSVRGAAIAGSFWTMAGYGGSQVLRLGGNIVLAWLLFPEAFALMALVNVVLHGLTMLSDFGIGHSIIQNRRGDTPEFLNTAWTLQIIRGLVLWLATCALAWPIAAFFALNDPMAWQLLYLLPVAGLAAVFAGFNSTKLYTLNRALKFRRLTSIELASAALGVAVMIAWVLLIDRSVWALVAGGLATALAKMILTHAAIAGHVVRLHWNGACARELFHFGKWVFLSTALAFAAMYLDKFILGAVLTLGELGIYAIAFAFAKVALRVSMRLSETVLFPVLSRFRDDPVRMVDVAIRGREVALTAGAAICLAYVIGSPLFFETVYDPRYATAGVTAQWITLYMWTTILLLSMNRIPLALGNSRALFVSNLLRALGLVLAIGGYALAGVPGFLIGLSIGPAVAHAFLLRDVPYRASEIARQSIRFTFIGGAYAAVALIASSAAKQTDSIVVWAGAVVVLIAVPTLLCGMRVWNHLQTKHDRRPAAAAPSGAIA